MDQNVINNIKTLALEMINRAGSGHSGIVLSAAPILYTLYSRHININTKDPNWLNRDRFVMSAGHGSAVLYSTLFMAGFGLTMDDIVNFRRSGFKTPGHPEVGVTPGVDVSTGPLGQGIATAVGLALGEKMLEARFKIGTEKPRSLFNYNIYVLVGDGDLMEGITYEAASFAANNGLNNLIVLYDSNGITLDGERKMSFNENVLSRFQAMGWNVENVKDGNSVSEINAAITKCKSSNRPSFIQVNNVINNNPDFVGITNYHSYVFSVDQIRKLKAKCLLPVDSFYVSPLATNKFKEMIKARCEKKYEAWVKDYREYAETRPNFDMSEIKAIFDETVNIDLENEILKYVKLDDERKALRDVNHRVMQYIAYKLPNFVGGAADVATSTKAYIDDMGNINYTDFTGRNIRFGVREHAMGAILNGLALTGFKVFGSTFLSFSDYMKPAIRMSALMRLPVTYVFTHDSVNIGQDGPTHQPIEQLAMLRATPNLTVLRPADVREIIGCWDKILHSYKTPSALIISKSEIPTLEGTNSKEVSRGAYIVHREINTLHGVIIATGSEVQTALILAKELYQNEKLDLRVVSMPIMEEFLKQSPEYQESILPFGVKRVVIEAGSSFGWHQFVYNKNYLITIDNFGLSGTRDEVLSSLSFSYNDIKNRIIKLFK